MLGENKEWWLAKKEQIACMCVLVQTRRGIYAMFQKRKNQPNVNRWKEKHSKIQTKPIQSMGEGKNPHKQSLMI